jgi:hypothetical protein
MPAAKRSKRAAEPITSELDAELAATFIDAEPELEESEESEPSADAMRARLAARVEAAKAAKAAAAKPTLMEGIVAQTARLTAMQEMVDEAPTEAEAEAAGHDWMRTWRRW